MMAATRYWVSPHASESGNAGQRAAREKLGVLQWSVAYRINQNQALFSLLGTTFGDDVGQLRAA